MIARFHCLLILIVLLAPGHAVAARADWTTADKAQLRLLVDATSPAPNYQGGLEIVLDPGWYTYWRDPGESGVPPVLDFSGSINVASVTVRYPVPERHNDGTSVSLIYRDEVVFLLDIAPVDPSEPITLAVDARFGVCSDICIPTRASSTVEAARPGAADPLTSARLDKFRQRLPGPPEPGILDIESVAVEGDGLIIDVRTPEDGEAALFSLAPQGWYLAQPKFVSRAGGVTRYRLPLAGRPADAEIAGSTFHFVAVAGDKAVERDVEIR